VGPNTAGKTNILEAISLLSTGKSFRAESDKETISWGEEMSRVSGITGDDTKLEIVLTNGMVSGIKTPIKKYLVNGVSKRMIDFVGKFRAVLFWPQHLDIVTGSPGLRRRYIDSVLVQVDREYRRNLQSYEKGLRQRNKLLERIKIGEATVGQLLFWDQLLIKAGGYITDTRLRFITYLNSTPFPVTSFSIRYDKSVISASRLEEYQPAEIASKMTLVGPHRDDCIFEFADIDSVKANREVAKYGSRGEQRLVVLWLKLGELAFLKDETGDKPVLLLDDIFSEFDESHRDLVWNIVASQQTILASADMHSMPEAIKRDVQVIELENNAGINRVK